MNKFRSVYKRFFRFKGCNFDVKRETRYEPYMLIIWHQLIIMIHFNPLLEAPLTFIFLIIQSYGRCVFTVCSLCVSLSLTIRFIDLKVMRLYRGYIGVLLNDCLIWHLRLSIIEHWIQSDVFSSFELRVFSLWDKRIRMNFEFWALSTVHRRTRMFSRKKNYVWHWRAFENLRQSWEMLILL